MKNRKKSIVWIVLISILILPSYDLQAQKHTIKFATLAPDGSTWMNIMREFDQDLREKTDGEVGFKIYGGGVLGDEKDVLRKIRIGQLHAGGFTGVGLGEVSSNVRILDTPFLFRNYEEADYIYEKFNDTFAEGFSKNGYELLGWAEVGFVYVFAKEPVATLDDIRKTKMWVWQGDQVAEATFKAFGLNPIPLSVIDVMTALQTNMVEGVYTSPLAGVVMQWYTKVNYMMEIPLANASGAVLISNKMFNKIPQEQQQIIKSLGQKYMRKLTVLSREDNVKAIETLKKNGIKVLPPPNEATLNDYYQVGESARKSLVDKFYSQNLLGQLASALADFRSKNGDN